MFSLFRSGLKAFHGKRKILTLDVRFQTGRSCLKLIACLNRPYSRLSPISQTIALVLVLGLSSCANTTWGQRLEQSLSIPAPLDRGDTSATGNLENPDAVNPIATSDRNPENNPDGNPESSPPSNPEIAVSPTPSASVEPRPTPSFSVSTPPSPAVGSLVGSPGNSPATQTETIAALSPSLQTAVEAVLALNAFPWTEQADRWEKPVTRRQFAQWLFAMHNRLYSDRPGQQIRPSSPTAKPIFQDLPTTDPDFAVIQGLAEAGILPSPLRGNGAASQFRPEAALTREQLILWKVPLDARKALPKTSIDRIEQTWNFQDASQINGEALGAVLLDFENGELSNIRRVFGYTTLLQPQKLVTQAEAIAVLDYFGFQGQGVSAQDVVSTNP